MSYSQINFACDETLKNDFEKSIKLSGYSTMAEAFRDFMRKTVSSAQSLESSQKPKESQEKCL